MEELVNVQKFMLLVSAIHEDLCITQFCLESNLVVILSELSSNGVMEVVAAPLRPPSRGWYRRTRVCVVTPGGSQLPS